MTLNKLTLACAYVRKAYKPPLPREFIESQERIQRVMLFQWAIHQKMLEARRMTQP